MSDLLELAAANTTTRVPRPATLTELDAAVERHHLAVAGLRRRGAEDLITMLGLDRPPAADRDLSVCEYEACGAQFLPSTPKQRFCRSVCATRQRHQPAQNRTLQTTPTGVCPHCSDTVPLTPYRRVGRHRELRIRSTPDGARPYRSTDECPGFNDQPEPPTSKETSR